MRGLRFSIANLLIAFAVIGVAIVALNPPTRWKAELLLIATVCVLLTAVLAAINFAGNARAFWLGFALFGWFYFVVAFTAALPTIRHPIERPLYALRNAFWGTRVSAPESEPRRPKPGFEAFYDRNAGEAFTVPAWEYGFGETAHCLANLAFAIVGGFVGRALCAIASRKPTTA